MDGKKRSPPIKVLSSQLRDATQHPGPDAKGIWTVSRLGQAGGAPLQLSVVWMQGSVLEVKGENSTSVTLLDETGTFIVTGVKNIPQGKPCLTQGKYVMVMGILQCCSPEPVVKAVKVADLSDNPVHRKMWRYEVEDLQQILT